MTANSPESELITYSQFRNAPWLHDIGYKYVEVRETGASRSALEYFLTGTNVTRLALERLLSDHGVNFFENLLQKSWFTLFNSEYPFGKFNGLTKPSKKNIIESAEELTDRSFGSQQFADILVELTGACSPFIALNPSGKTVAVLCKQNLGVMVRYYSNQLMQVESANDYISSFSGSDHSEPHSDAIRKAANDEADKAREHRFASVMDKLKLQPDKGNEEPNLKGSRRHNVTLTNLPVNAPGNKIDLVNKSVDSFKLLPPETIGQVLALLLRTCRFDDEAIRLEEELTVKGYTDRRTLLLNLAETMPERLRAAGAMIFQRTDGNDKRLIVIKPGDVAYLKLWYLKIDPITIATKTGLTHADQINKRIKLTNELGIDENKLLEWFKKENNL